MLKALIDDVGLSRLQVCQIKDESDLVVKVKIEIRLCMGKPIDCRLELREKAYKIGELVSTESTIC